MWPLTSSTSACDAAHTTKNEERKQAIELAEKDLPEIPIAEDLPFLSASASQIVKNIDQMEPGWSATRVLEAYVRSAIRAQKAINPLTEITFEQARKDAKELDDHFAKTGKVIGNLHGVPISIKDHIDVKGVDTSIGFSKLCGISATEDAAVVAILRKAGAVIHTKTNIPQTMLAFECGNPVFGKTTNPYSPKLHTCGGSSGGEAALLASDGSAAGIGSDIGGSLRIPAHYSGCVGLKISPGRFPHKGVQSSAKGFESVASAIGPMGRTVEDLQLLSKTIVQGSEADSYWQTNAKPMPPLPWRDVELPEKLKLGYYTKDGLCAVSPPCQRAVQQTVDAMKAAGHDLVELEDPPTAEAMRIFIALSSADGYESLLADISNDPHEAPLFLVDLQRRLGPTIMHKLTGLAGGKDAQFAFIAGVAGTKSGMSFLLLLPPAEIQVAENMKWQKERDTFVARWRQHWWGDLKLDGIICPVQARKLNLKGPAITCGAGWNLAFLSAATILYNIVDSVAGVIPVTFVDAEKDDLTPEWSSDNPAGSFLLERALYGPGRNGKAVYNAQDMHGLPVGVQIVGPLFQEEKVLKMMEAADKALGERGFGPGAFSKRQAK